MKLFTTISLFLTGRRSLKASCLQTNHHNLCSVSQKCFLSVEILITTLLFAAKNRATHLSNYSPHFPIIQRSLLLLEPLTIILSYLSRSLADRWGTTVDFTTSFLHSSRFSAFRSVVFHSRPVHSLMLSSHRFLCLPLHRLVGLVVKASDSGAENLGFESRFWRDFSGSSHTSDLKIGTPVATLPGAWRCKVSAGTGRPGVSIL